MFEKINLYQLEKFLKMLQIEFDYYLVKVHIYPDGSGAFTFYQMDVNNTGKDNPEKGIPGTLFLDIDELNALTAKMQNFQDSE